jgi:glycosyltransferase involved in cell wall biosynthesis
VPPEQASHSGCKLMPGPRVLFVNHTSTGAGAELVLLDLVQAWAGASAYLFENGTLNAAMRSRGVQVQVARWGGGLASVRRDSNLLRALPLVGQLAATTAGLARAARRHDVIYANSQKAFVLASAAAVLARRPLIWHLHDIISAAHFGQGQRRLQVGLANRCAARVIVPSDVAAEAFTAAGGRAGLVHVIPNGIDLVRDPTPPAALRERLGLPPGPLIGVFSRLAPWKGQHVVLQALARLPGVRCILAGGALFGEHAYARTLHELARDLGIADRVQFLGQRSDVPRLMQACDAVIHPSVDPEPFGRTLIEAMLMRAPIIASDTGAPSEILEGGAAGTLVPPGDVSALAAAVTAVLANPLRLMTQLDRAEARAHSQYGVVPMRARTVDLIGRVVAERRAGAAAVRRVEV